VSCEYLCRDVVLLRLGKVCGDACAEPQVIRVQQSIVRMRRPIMRPGLAIP